MIGHGHIDPVWLWRWPEGMAVVLSTFRSALDRMKESPGMVFTCSSALFYQWVADNDPAMLKEVIERIKEGRWDVVGGWWIEPDMNMPHGESMARQGLYGQLTLQKLLGVRAKVAFNPDAFGHAATIPQIVKLQGMEKYVFMRPMSWEKQLPADLFWWKGADETQVIAYRIQDDYATNPPVSVRARLHSCLGLSEKQPMKSFMSFYGVGDHGGGPTKENIRLIEEIKREKGAPQLAYATVDSYFEGVLKDKNLTLPTIKDDLQHHAVGCYTTESAIKKGNRVSEAALIIAEKIAATGSLFWGAHYPKEQITEAWKKVLFLQFHDSLPGTSLVSHSQDAANGYGYAKSVADQATYEALQKLEWQIAASDPESKYLIVFNPHAWPVKSFAVYGVGFRQIADNVRVTDDEGNLLCSQYILGEAQTLDTRGIVFQIDLPAMGYRQIRIKEGQTHLPKVSVKAAGNIIENEYYTLSVSNAGKIGIFDKRINKDIFTGGATGCAAVVIDDPSDTWSHGTQAYTNVIGAFGNADIHILDAGPLKATIRVISTYGKSTLTIDWVLYANSDEIEANVSLDWHEQFKMLKFSFPNDLSEVVSTYEVPYGFITRATDGKENPGQRWVDISGTSKGETYGLTIINDGKYGYSIDGSDLRVSIARSAVYAHHDPKKIEPEKGYVFMDQGIQNFRMLLIPHMGKWQKAGIPRRAEEFMTRPICMYQGIHPGTLPKSASFINVDAPNVIASSVKKSESGDDIIIRLVETLGVKSSAAVKISNHSWTGFFRPLEIKSLRYNWRKGTFAQVNILEEKSSVDAAIVATDHG
ncbi:hypothetical protein GCM10027516_32450 [Niabella aquatica]